MHRSCTNGGQCGFGLLKTTVSKMLKTHHMYPYSPPDPPCFSYSPYFFPAQEGFPLSFISLLWNSSHALHNTHFFLLSPIPLCSPGIPLLPSWFVGHQLRHR